jgi:phage gp29-like protein
MVASRILGPDGQPIQKSDLKVPQTSLLHSLHHEFQGHPSRGLTPSKLAGIMQSAEQGDIVAQYELYEDMEEKDGHILSEMSKRRRAVTALEWTITPPNNASAAEEANAEKLSELMQGLDDFEDVLFDITDAIGKGFCCLEIEWENIGKAWLPKSIQHRPQSWFQLNRGFTQTIMLRGAGGGTALQPFGWMVHKHKAKSGYLERSALFRVLAWPYLFKNYSLGDLAEFLEIYGIPLRLGKYPSGATETEKLTLLQALTQIGHNAAGIIPAGMEIEFNDAATGDPAAFKLMMEWCDKTQSKAILGGTLTSQADGASSTNALGNVHNEVRKELTDSDVKQVAKTVSRDLLYPIALLNGLTMDWQRCPRMKFDTNEPEDMTAMSTALPTFVDMGFRIGRQWAQERVGIPEPEDGEDILMKKPEPAPVDMPPAGSAALNAQRVPLTASAQLDDTLQQVTNLWIDKIHALVNAANSLDEIRDGLVALLPTMPVEQYASFMAEALRAAQLTGRNDVLLEASGGG